LYFFFSVTLSDSFKISLLSPKYDKEWSYIESNLKRDSIMVWITDTIVSKSDTLKFELKYEVLDSMEQMVIKRDTLEMFYNAQKAPKPKRKKDEVIPLPTINLSNNINSTAHDIYRRINIEAPEPLISFDLDRIRLYSLEDTIKKQIPITVQKDSNSVRKFFVEHQWIENSYYVFQIDSAAARNIYGVPNNTVDQKFKIQKEGFYGKIFLTLTGLKEPAIVQLLSNDKDEKVLQKIQVLGDGKIEFPYLSPNKYKLRVISDPNKNGKWDTGYLANSIQPEKVFYYPKIIKIKSNFDIVETWKIDFRPDYKKELIDEEVEKEKARKKEQGIKSTTTNGK